MGAPRITPLTLLLPRLRGVRNRWDKAPPGTRLAYSVFVAVGVLFWVGLLAGLIVGMGRFFEVEVFGPVITRRFMEMLMLSLFTLLLFSNVVTALSNFYLSEDLELVLSLPVSPPVFFYSRVTETMMQAGWAMAMFGLPVFIAYGVVNGAGWTYYLCLLAVIPSFLAIPAAVGAAFASLLVTTFPARRVRELLVLLGLVALVVILMLIRLLRPEQLVDPEAFESVAAAAARLQAPVPPLFPPRWASDVLGAAAVGKALPRVELGLMITGTIASLGISRWLTTRLFADGWTRSQEAREARLARSPLLDRGLALVLLPLPRKLRAIVVKDVKVFIRDPAQWSQAFLLISLVAIYLVSVNAVSGSLERVPFMQGFKNVAAFLNLGAVGFVMAAIGARFQFAVVSGEGRAFWILRSAPLDPTAYLRVKSLPGMLPMVAVGQVLVIVSNVLLDSPLALTVAGSGTALGLAFGVSGIAMGMGAAYPDFKADNIARAAAGPAAVLFMVVALMLVLVVVGLEMAPSWFILRADYTEGVVTDREAAISAVCYALVALVCAAATVLPVRFAAKGLWERTL